jgi:hypothetical protein
MSTVAEIESAIERLSAKEKAELMEHLEERGLLRASTAALFQMYDEEEGEGGAQWLGGDEESVSEV